MPCGEGGGEEGVEQNDGLVKVPDEDAIDLHREEKILIFNFNLREILTIGAQVGGLDYKVTP